MDIRHALLPLVAIASSTLLVMAGCGSSGSQSPLIPVAPSAPKPDNSVTLVTAPASQAVLTAKLNQLRADTYRYSGGAGLVGVQSHDVLFTSAARHARYLDSVNANGYRSDGTGTGASSDRINARTTLLTEFDTEAWGGAVPPQEYPIFYTSNAPVDRVTAVVGGNDLVRVNTVGGRVVEEHVFYGIINNPDTGSTSPFRGFPVAGWADAGLVSAYGSGPFDPIESAWYNRRGRHKLLQPSLKYFGYGCVNDLNRARSPVPILDGRYVGTVDLLYGQPETKMLGFWPSDGSVIYPYGTDTDMTLAGQRSQWSGVPIHFTLPTVEPIEQTGVRVMTLRKSGSSTLTGSELRYRAMGNAVGLQVPTPAAPSGSTDTYYAPIGNPAPKIPGAKVMSIQANHFLVMGTDLWTYTVTFDSTVDMSSFVSGSDSFLGAVNNVSQPPAYVVNAVAGNPQQVTWTVSSISPISWMATVATAQGTYTPGGFTITYQTPNYQLTGDIIPANGPVAALVDTQLSPNELVLIPTQPLDPNATYFLDFQIRSTSYDSTLDPNLASIRNAATGVCTIRFTTNGVIPPR